MKLPDPDAVAAHRDAQELLPWLLNGSLQNTERDSVLAHLEGCEQCRSELALLGVLRHARPGTPASDPERALARLRPALAATVQDARPGGNRRQAPEPAANDGSWWRTASARRGGALALMLGLAGVLCFQVQPPAIDHAYRLLGAEAGPEASMVVMFAPATRARERRRILQASGARVVGGPTAAGAWMLAAADGSEAAILERLRAEPLVVLAEPLHGDGPP